MFNGTNSTSLEQSLRRAIVPTGADAATKARIARLLLDLAGELGQTGGMPPNPHAADIDAAAKAAHPETITTTLAAWKLEHDGKMAARYIQQVQRLMLDLFEHAKKGGGGVAELVRDDINAFLNHVGTVGRGRDIWHTQKAASAKTLNDYLGSIRSVLQWCVQTGRAPQGNVAAGIGWFGGRRGGGSGGRDVCDERAFTLEEARAIIAAAPPQRAVLYRFMCETGMRIGTCEKLLRKHFDFMECRVKAPGEITKNGRTLVLPISTQLAEDLAAHVGGGGRVGEVGGGIDGGAGGGGVVMFGRRPHRKSLDLDQKRAGVALIDDMGRKAGFHAFRRFVASELLNRGVNPKAVQQRLDHADIRTTMKYNNVRKGAQEDITGAMAAMMEGRTGGAVGVATVAGATGRGSRGGASTPYPLQPAANTGNFGGGGGAGRGELRQPGREWALQGSNEGAWSGADGAQQAGAQQDTICRMIGMLMSGCTQRQAAMVLRAVADTLLAESAITVVPGGVSDSAQGFGAPPPAPSAAAPIAAAG